MGCLAECFATGDARLAASIMLCEVQKFRPYVSRAPFQSSCTKSRGETHGAKPFQISHFNLHNSTSRKVRPAANIHQTTYRHPNTGRKDGFAEVSDNGKFVLDHDADPGYRVPVKLVKVTRVLGRTGMRDRKSKEISPD